MDQQEQRTGHGEATAHHGPPVNPILVALISGSYSMVAMMSVTTLAVLAGLDELRARPPQIAWDLVAVFVGGMALATFLHFLLLAWLRGGQPWPWKKQVGWRLLGALAGGLAMSVTAVLALPWDPSLYLLAVTMLITAVVSLLPMLVCMIDFFQYQSTRLNERVRLVPLSPADLPPAVRTYFDRHTDGLLPHGFQLLGDYQLKQHTPTIGRFFLNAGRDTFAEINYTRIHLVPIRTVCFFSLTPDGFYLESSNTRLFGKRPAAANFQIQSLPGASILEIYQQHQRRLREVDHGTPRPLAVEDLEPIIWFGIKRLYESLIAQGRAATNPYADFDDTPLLPEAVAWPACEPRSEPRELATTRR